MKLPQDFIDKMNKLLGDSANDFFEQLIPLKLRVIFYTELYMDKKQNRVLL